MLSDGPARLGNRFGLVTFALERFDHVSAPHNVFPLLHLPRRIQNIGLMRWMVEVLLDCSSYLPH